MAPRPTILPPAVAADLRESWFDRALARVAPRFALARAEARTQLVGYRVRTGQYQAARGDRPNMRDWTPRAQSADDDGRGDHEQLRARARAMVRDSPLGTSAMIAFRTGIVGNGLQPFPRLDRELLGLSEEQAAVTEVALRRAFQAWGASKWSSYDATMRFGAQQVMVLVSMLVNGDHFAVFRRRTPPTAGQVGLALQHLEADLISTPLGKESDPTVVEGVEYVNGVAARIHVANQYPWSHTLQRPVAWQALPIWRDDARPLVLHVVDHDRRPGQARGVSKFAPVMETMRASGVLAENELTAALVASLFTVFLPSVDGATGLDPDTGVPLDAEGNPIDPAAFPMMSGSASTPRDITAPQLKLGSGIVAQGLPGEKPEIIESKRPNPAFAPFFTALAQLNGAGLGIAYELLLRRFTSSYTASQGAMQETWRTFRAYRTALIEEFCQPVYEEVIADFVAAGLLDLPGFFSDPVRRQAYLLCDWRGPVKGHLNPVQDARAMRERIEVGITSREEERADYNGGEWEGSHVQQAKEQRFRVEDGLAAPITAPAAARVAAPVPPDNDDDTETEDDA